MLQALGIAVFATGTGYGGFVAAAAVAGLGTAMVYPTLLALVADVVEPARRASALGIYRFWRDSGYAVGALGAGLVADRVGPSGAMSGVAAFVLISAAIFWARTRGR